MGMAQYCTKLDESSVNAYSLPVDASVDHGYVPDSTVQSVLSSNSSICFVGPCFRYWRLCVCFSFAMSYGLTALRWPTYRSACDDAAIVSCCAIAMFLWLVVDLKREVWLLEHVRMNQGGCDHGLRVCCRGRDRRRSEERGRSVSRERGRGRDKDKGDKRDASPHPSPHTTDDDEEEGDNKYRKNVSVPPLLPPAFSAFLRCAV